MTIQVKEFYDKTCTNWQYYTLIPLLNYVCTIIYIYIYSGDQTLKSQTTPKKTGNTNTKYSST